MDVLLIATTLLAVLGIVAGAAGAESRDAWTDFDDDHHTGR